MKRIIVLVACMGTAASFGQQADEGRGQRSQGKPRETTTNVTARTGQSAAVAEEPKNAASANQDNYDDIMGSFSEMAMKFSEQDSSDIEMHVYQCRHIGGEAFTQALEPFLTVNGEMSACEEADLVIISDERENLEKLKVIAETIDRPIRQVLVSASIVEFQIVDGFEKDISMQYNQFVNMDQLGPLPGGGVASSGLNSAFATRMMDAILPAGGNPASLSGQSSYMYYNPEEQFLFSAFLTFLETQGKARILSSPSLLMRRGHTGNILSGEDIPITESNVGSGGTTYSVEYKSVGIKLRVTPESIFEERVVLEVSPEVSNIIRYEESNAGRNPVIAIRNASTMLEMSDDEMVSIGGLLREEMIETEKRVPILGAIPIVGSFFRSTSSEEVRSQLVIFLTVNVVDPSDLNADTINPNVVPEELQEQIDATHDSMPEQTQSIFRDISRWFK